MTTFLDISTSSTFSELKAPFTTALRTVSRLELFTFSIKLSDGRVGIGQCVETPAITGDTKVQILEDLTGTLTSFLQGHTFSTYEDIAPELAKIAATSSAKAAVDMALYNLENSKERSKFQVGTDVTVPIARLEELDSLIATRVHDGFSVFKVKLGLESIELSIAKLMRINNLIGAKGRIRLDPNQSWSLEHSLAMLRAIENAHIEIDFLEQPTPAGEKDSLARIRQQGNVKVMADESCFTMKDLVELIELDAVDLVNLKLLKSGGLYSSFEMARVAREAGIGVFVGSMMEGDVGVSNAINLAHTLAPLEVHDLDAAWWAKASTVRYDNGMVVA